MRKTRLTIESGKFMINGEFTYKERFWKGTSIEGLLFNTRMVQGIFDDKNPETVGKWAYPDTGVWDSLRNTNEFIEAMSLWKENGVYGFTINLQGGSPEGYSKEQPWYNSTFAEDGSLDYSYMERLEKILDEADTLKMVPILGYFYFGQADRLKNEKAVIKGVKNATNWILEKGYTNVLIEVNNECNCRYTHDILKPERVHELIQLIQGMKKDGRRLLVSTSYAGGTIPGDNVISCADFILMHGNSVENTEDITKMVQSVRGKNSFKGQPILFNEDDHFDFDREENNMLKALENRASWGYFDPGQSNYRDGYQCPPVNWGINTERKKEFFELVKKLAIQ